ncbi:MAG: inositol 2-dehydrogenase [Acetobacteraceae bacterium]
MIRIAVLGAGRIGRIHAANAAANPRCRLVAIADTVEAAATALATKHGAETATDPRVVIARPDLDAVVICTPTATHVDLLLEAARRGKAVLCEKPVDLEIRKVDAAITEALGLGARAMVAFNRRFDPSASAIRAAIDRGEIGEVRQVIITSRDPEPPSPSYVASSGGIFRDMTIHDFDMARWLLGEEPTEVFAMAGALVDPAIGQAGDFDTLMIVLCTASGRQCHINNCRQTAYGYDQRIEVFGTRGMLLNDNLRPSTLRRYDAKATEVRAPLLNFFLERYQDAYRLELDAFLAALDGKQPMPLTLEDGRRALRLADAALESANSARVVTV